MNKFDLCTRPGVVMSMICGRMFLVPTRKASEEGKLNITPLTITGAVIWSVLSKGESPEVAYKAVGALQRKQPDEVKGAVNEFLSAMKERGFLIEKGGSDE